MTDAAPIEPEPPPPPFRLTIGTVMVAVVCAAVFFALLALLDRRTSGDSSPQFLWPTSVGAPVLLFATTIALLRRFSFARTLGTIAATATLALIVVSMLDIDSPTDERGLHLGLMAGIALTVVLPLILRRLARKRFGPGKARDNLLAVASTLFAAWWAGLIMAVYFCLLVSYS